MTEIALLEVKPTATPFLRFNARLGWPLGDLASRPQVPQRDRDLQLAIAGRSPIPLAEPFGTFGGRTLPRGLAITSEGRIFLADPEQRVILTATGDAPSPWRFRPLWAVRPLPQPVEGGIPELPARPADPYTLVRPVDLALAPNGDLVVVDQGASRVLVLALPSARLRQLIDLAPGSPSAVAFDQQGSAYVADPVEGTVHRFDRRWRRDASFPRASLAAPNVVTSAASGGAGTCGDTCSCSSTSPCGELPARRAVIHVLDQGTLVGLDERGRLVPAREEDVRPVIPSLVPTATGLSWLDPALPGRQPIRIDGIDLTPDGRHRETFLPLLAMPRRVELPRYGAFTTTELDGGVTGFVWDRVTFRVTLPETTRLVVSTLTSEVEIRADQLELLPPGRWSPPLAIEPGDVPELLVQSGAGRYLWIKVELSGDGTVSPVISEIDVFGPRRSAMRHLPASFHQDPESVRFLDRYLSYFDTIFAEITRANRDVATLFDPVVTPTEFVSWLGSWFDLDFLASWSDDVRRAMIRNAIPYFRMRGTVAGLQRILQWHTGLAGPLPRVIEHFRLPIGGDPVMIGGAALDPGSVAHSFTIVMPAAAVPESGRPVLERLIEASIPAHTHYRLRLIDPGITIAAQSTVGIDMTLASSGVTTLGVGGLDVTLATAAVRPEALVHYPQHVSRPQLQGGSKC